MAANQWAAERGESLFPDSAAVQSWTLCTAQFFGLTVQFAFSAWDNAH